MTGTAPAAQEGAYYEGMREEFFMRATEKFLSASLVAVSLSPSSDTMAVLLSHLHSPPSARCAALAYEALESLLLNGGAMIQQPL